MAQQFWLNLPVQNINRSKEFFEKLGFKFNMQYASPNSACMLAGENNTIIMLFEEPAFKGFTNAEVADTAKYAETLLSIGVDTKEGVDELVTKVIEAGGISGHKPYEMTGWMYGCLFTDLDGHRWNPLYMDMSKMNS